MLIKTLRPVPGPGRPGETRHNYSLGIMARITTSAFVPVAGDGLVALGGLGAALGDVGRPVHGEVAGEQEDLFLVLAQPAAQAVSGVIAGVPVAEPVVDDPGPDGCIVAVPQVVENLVIQGGVPAGPGVLDGPVRLAQDRDDVPGPVLRAAGAEFLHGPARSEEHT